MKALDSRSCAKIAQLAFLNGYRGLKKPEMDHLNALLNKAIDAGINHHASSAMMKVNDSAYALGHEMRES